MRLHETLLSFLAFITLIHALALPSSLLSLSEASKELFKRKGGGGGGGRGGGSSSGGSRGSGSTTSGSTSGSSGSRSGSSSTSNTGGSTRSGSGATRGYGGGQYYGGGAAVPYSAGASRRGVSPALLGVGAGAAIFPGLWLYGAYAYHYPGYYNYRNNTNNMNESMPVTCLCEQYNPCGCDQNNNTDYLTSVANNQTVSRVSNVNGTETLVVNGTLPNGTTAPGGTDSAATSLKQGLLETSGFWIVIAGVVYTVYGM